MPEEIIIRHAKLQDVETYRELRLEGLKNHPDTFGQDYDDAASRDHEYWENTLKINNKEKALFFATKDKQLIGMTGIYRGMSRKSQHGATIWGVYVRPDWRGKHISESLVSACLGWAKQEGIIIVHLGVVTNNIPAIRCYEHCGFTTYGTQPKAIYYNSKYYDEYLMAVEIKQ